MTTVDLPRFGISFTDGQNMHLYILVIRSWGMTDVTIVTAADELLAWATGAALGMKVERVVPMMTIIKALAAGEVDIASPPG